jgi:AcrR family transcriptional regulator
VPESPDDLLLPPGVARAWGLDDRPRKGPRPGLSLDAITTAAIELADAEGLGALSMSRIANHLGFTTMALYRYVDSKDELLAILLDAVSGAPEPLVHAADGWRPALQEWAERQIHLLLAHPWALDLPMPGPPMGPNALQWLEQPLAALADTGLEPWEQLAVVGLVSSYGLSEARLTSQQGEQTVAYGRYLQLLVDPARLPALAKVVASGQLDEPPPHAADGFDEFTHFGLERILDGVQALIDSRHPPRSGRKQH